MYVVVMEYFKQRQIDFDTSYHANILKLIYCHLHSLREICLSIKKN